MQTLLSLPQNLLTTYQAICRPNQASFFIESDPQGSHLGSGGGTAWILKQFAKAHEFMQKKILIHAGGQGRRLPSYSASGKIFYTNSCLSLENWAENRSDFARYSDRLL